MAVLHGPFSGSRRLRLHELERIYATSLDAERADDSNSQKVSFSFCARLRREQKRIRQKIDESGDLVAPGEGHGEAVGKYGPFRCDFSVSSECAARNRTIPEGAGFYQMTKTKRCCRDCYEKIVREEPKRWLQESPK